MNEFHSNYKHQREVIDWARRVLTSSNYIILDTETTGLGKMDEIIELAIINNRGKIVFNERIRPTNKKVIDKSATKVHGINIDDIQNCPIFYQIHHKLKETIKNKEIISYNADYDRRIFNQTCQAAGIYILIKGWECGMVQYAKFIGEWNAKYNQYKWQKLPSSDHSALGDCLATFTLLENMASTEKPKRWYEFWVNA